MRQKPTPSPESRLGSISAGEILPLRLFGSRLGLGNKSLAEIQRRGLRAVQFGKCKYVLGSDALAFFAKLAEHQAQPGAAALDHDNGEARGR